MAILLSKDASKWALARLDVWIRTCWMDSTHRQSRLDGMTESIYGVHIVPFCCVIYILHILDVCSQGGHQFQNFFCSTHIGFKDIYIYRNGPKGLVLELISPVVLQQLNFLYYLFNLWFDSGWQHANSETQIIFVLHNLYQKYIQFCIICIRNISSFA